MKTGVYIGELGLQELPFQWVGASVGTGWLGKVKKPSHLSDVRVAHFHFRFLCIFMTETEILRGGSALFLFCI